MLTLRFKWYKFNADVYYFIDKKTRELVIVIVYVSGMVYTGVEVRRIDSEMSGLVEWP